MISPQPTAVNKIAPTPEVRIPTKVDPSKVAIAHFVIPTRERSETGGTRCPQQRISRGCPIHAAASAAEASTATNRRMEILTPNPAAKPRTHKIRSPRDWELWNPTRQLDTHCTITVRKRGR